MDTEYVDFVFCNFTEFTTSYNTFLFSGVQKIFHKKP